MRSLMAHRFILSTSKNLQARVIPQKGRKNGTFFPCSCLFYCTTKRKRVQSVSYQTFVQNGINFRAGKHKGCPALSAKKRHHPFGWCLFEGYSAPLDFSDRWSAAIEKSSLLETRPSARYPRAACSTNPFGFDPERSAKEKGTLYGCLFLCERATKSSVSRGKNNQK